MTTSKGLLTASTALALALTATAWAPSAQAQQQTQTQQQAAQTQGGQERIDITTWNNAREELRQGWTAEWMFDQPVYGRQGEDIGEVDNIFIGTDGSIEAIVVEAGGFWDIGDTHLRIPWSEVELEGRRIFIDVAEEQVPDFDLFNFDDEQGPGPRAFRATELIGDYVALQDEANYGYVSDIVFDMSGQVSAVIVSPSYGYGARYGSRYGYYAYPYYGYGYGYEFEPGADRYRMPYTTDEVAEVDPIDYTVYDVDVVEVGEDGGQVQTGGAQGQDQGTQVQPQRQ